MTDRPPTSPLPPRSDTNGSVTLMERAERFRAASASAVPGRLAELLAARVARLNGDAEAALPPADVSEAEATAIELAEQFVVDVHGLTDEFFVRLRAHFADDEIVAIMFHLACLDGFGKLASVTAPADQAGPNSEVSP